MPPEARLVEAGDRHSAKPSNAILLQDPHKASKASEPVESSKAQPPIPTFARDCDFTMPPAGWRSLGGRCVLHIERQRQIGSAPSALLPPAVTAGKPQSHFSTRTAKPSSSR